MVSVKLLSKTLLCRPYHIFLVRWHLGEYRPEMKKDVGLLVDVKRFFKKWEALQV